MIRENIRLDFSKPIGDPFVEIGRLGLVEFCGKDRFDDFEEFRKDLLKLIRNVYLGKKFLAFWLNVPLARGKTDELKISKTIEKFNNFLNSKKEVCNCCGNFNTTVIGDRTIYPLGAGVLNFNSVFNKSINLCLHCYSSLFCLPINSQIVKDGKKLYVFFLLGSVELNNFWLKYNQKSIKKSLLKMNQDYILMSEFSIYENFIYYLLEKIIKKNIFSESITFYKFRNTNNSTELELQILHIGANQLKFLNIKSTDAFIENARLRRDQLKIWHYLIAKNFYNTTKINLNIQHELKKNRTNRVITKFVNNENIFFIMKADFEKEYKNIENIEDRLRYAKAYRSLIFKYLKEIRKMDKERLDYLKKLAEKIANSNNGKSFLSELSRCKRADEFRLLLINQLKQFSKNGENLFNTDEFVYKLLPKDTYFSETRDILIVAMYEFLDKKELKELDEIKIEKTIEGDENEQ